MVALVHVKEQSRLSLGSYDRPRMTEELKGVRVDVGHRRVGRVRRENSPPDCFLTFCTFVKTIKAALIWRGPWETSRQAETALDHCS